MEGALAELWEAAAGGVVVLPAGPDQAAFADHLDTLQVMRTVPGGMDWEAVKPRVTVTELAAGIPPWLGRPETVTGTFEESFEEATTVAAMLTLAALWRVKVTWPDSPAYMAREQEYWEQVPETPDEVSLAETPDTESGSLTLAVVEPVRTV